MKALSLFSLASALALVAISPLEAQQTRERGEQTREEPRRGGGLIGFAARALGASDEEAEAAALLLPAVQSLTAGSGGGQAGGVNVGAGDINNDGVISLADCQLALHSPHSIDPAAAAAFIRFDGVDGESARDVRECGHQLSALLLPAVQKVREPAAATAAPHVRVIDGRPSPLTGEAEITLKRGAAPARRGN